MYCPKCGMVNNATFCPNCGTPQQSRQPEPVIINNYNTTIPVSDKDKWVAFILCFFLGALGIHRFYVGKIGTGVLYLLTLGLLGIGVFVDLIVILCGSFKDSYGRPLK